MEYTGEHLWVGFVGHALAILAFVSSLLAAFAYAKGASKNNALEDQQNWKRIGRYSFLVHGFSIFAVSAIK